MHISKKIFLTIVRSGVSIAILFYIFTHPDMRIQEMFEAIKGMPLVLLFIAIAIYGVVIMLSYFRWLLILKSFRFNMPFILGLKLLFIGLYFNNMMPSLTGGDIIKAYYTAKGTHRKIEAVASIFLDRVIGVFAVMILAAFGSICALFIPELKILSAIILGLIFLFVIGITIFLNKELVSKIPLIKTLLIKTGFLERMQRMYFALISLKNNKKIFFKALLLALLMQSLIVIMNYVIAIGLGLKGVAFLRFFMFIPIAGIISAIPISFAGWGIGEGAYNALFKLMNPSYGVIAVAISIVCRLIMLLWSMIGGPIYIFYRHITFEREDDVILSTLKESE